ncbi:MAG: hypothetical protein P0Y49_08785 [Candidatus Pedobacter colombiensis]|uniref:Uncharacterized protein n=1 Tax=Candidatus Pedobacter colombiensis TaxID=3121371 RepID=A0AAJ5WCQ9_9SPHI|nr:hypothetical protein [Pedobacter sp.]WEK21236.1 MAG: hypothetical protein P0Y49_08785 [Pedobacter sp.]
MKNKTLYIALLSFVILYTSCSKISENIREDIFVNDTVYFNIPVLSDSTASATISGITSNLNLAEEIKKSANSFTIANIKTTKITSLNLDLGTISKDSIDTKNNFANLGTLKFGFSTNGTITNIANITIPSTATISHLTLSPSIPPESLTPILTAPSPTYNVIVKAKAPTTTLMRVRAAAAYTITLSK